jgi:hypothetical protein
VRGLARGLEARAAVMTDEAAVTIGATNQGMVSGDMVNTASRLQSVAAPSTVVVGEGTVRAAGSAIVFEQADAKTLKGKTAPVAAWRAVRVVAQRGGIGRSEAALEAPFVGRDEELRQLKDLFHATGRELRARLVSVVGPGGIGKSRLAWELEKYLDGLVENIWWHDGRSPAYGDGITFWALGEMIRGRARLQETDDEPTTRAAVRAMLDEHVPDAAERAWIEPAMLSLLGVGTQETSPEQFFGAWRTFFERLATTGPVVMVFEDLHHADAGLLDFIDHMAEWSRSVPIMIITLARPELLDKRPDWGAGKRNFTSIYLEPLSTAAMQELLAGLVPGLPVRARDAIVERADGVPLYAVETVRMLLAQGRLQLEAGIYTITGDLADLSVPETLTALISSRLDELDSADRSLVADASVLGQSFGLAGLAAVSSLSADELEERLHSLVRRELLVQQIDPRSPERGQYTFVQSLIREVAYNTLARRDRKVRHLAAARFFESLGSDELAGALAGHYLSAHDYAEGAEADALAAQARVALRGAAERAAALGSHAQALVFLEKALSVSPSAADRADLHTRALAAALRGLDADVAERHAAGAVKAWREIGDREQLAMAIAAQSDAINFYGLVRGRALEIARKGWEELNELEGTPAGVALMLEVARGHGALGDDKTRLEWLERLLPTAERLGLVPDIAKAMMSMSLGLSRTGRPQQAQILLRGAHDLATANNVEAIERNVRTLLTFRSQFDDPVEGLSLAREGLEIARRQGSTSYGFLMVGNAVSCAIRTGDWEWARALLDEWLATEAPGGFYLEMNVDRAVLSVLSGADPSVDLAAADELVQTIEDEQFASYIAWARAWQALLDDRFDEAQRHGSAAVDTTDFFAPIALPLTARAALWAGDPTGAAKTVDRLEATVLLGQASRLDRTTLRAGIAALEGRRTESITMYREALRGWKQLGCAFEEALATLDLARLLAPTEREMAEAAAAVSTARQTFERLGARPLLERLVTGPAAIPEAQPASSAGETQPVRA